MAEHYKGDPAGKCQGAHRFFALDMIGYEALGTVLVPVVCTVCGDLVMHTLEASPGFSFLEHIEKSKKEK